MNEYPIDTPPSDDDYEINKRVAGLPETTGMGSGAIQGFIKKKVFDKQFYKSRNEIIEQLILQKQIKEHLNGFLWEKFENFKNKKLNEIRFQQAIYKMVLLEKKDVEKDPHTSTGINVLEDLLKKIIPTVEEDYKTLTTDISQRKSYRSHIIRAVQQLLDGININQKAGSVALAPITEEVDVIVGDPTKDEKFIDIDKKDQPEKEKDIFSIKGENETGRNMAKATFDQIEKSIIDSYSILSDEKDKELFYMYLLANVRLYFDKFENDISNVVDEPDIANEIPANNETPFL